MCRILSLVVIPKTGEVLTAPGCRRHSEICTKLGLPYDRVFKPEIRLSKKEIEFSTAEQQIAFRSSPSIEMLQLVQEQLIKEGNSEVFDMIEIKGVWHWERTHVEAVHKWMGQNIPDAKKLIEFSEETWAPADYVGTTMPGTDSDQLLRLPKFTFGDCSLREERMVRQLWLIDFSKPTKRSYAWVR